MTIPMVAQLVVSTVFGIVLFGVALFVPAGTLDYPQAWVFIAVFIACTIVPSIYLAVRHPEVLARRLKAGPTAEARVAQQIITSALLVVVVATLVVSALDWRFGWSTVPLWAVVVGEVLVVIGLVGAQLVVVVNSYAGASITVETDQPLVATGVYGIVRHPMYSAATLMIAGMPVALGSWWGLIVAAPAVALLAARITDEEKMLADELAGYREYQAAVRYRLIPGLW